MAWKLEIKEIIQSLLDQARDKEALANGDSDSIFAADAQALREAVVLLIKEVVPMGFHERCLGLEIKRRFETEKKLPRWRDVMSERPGKSGEYLCVIEDINGLSWQDVREYSVMNDCFLTSGAIAVTQWMPLPEMPEEDEE